MLSRGFVKVFGSKKIFIPLSFTSRVLFALGNQGPFNVKQTTPRNLMFF